MPRLQARCCTLSRSCKCKSRSLQQPSSTIINGKSKESFKELNLGRSQAAAGNNGRAAGRESPESGSLYSDYESGQQYEDKVSLLATWMKCDLIAL